VQVRRDHRDTRCRHANAVCHFRISRESSRLALAKVEPAVVLVNGDNGGRPRRWRGRPQKSRHDTVLCDKFDPFNVDALPYDDAATAHFDWPLRLRRTGCDQSPQLGAVKSHVITLAHYWFLSRLPSLR
jgi:hypothetical protein